MSDFLSKPGTNLPPEQEAIRARCFHPTGTFVEFKKEEIEQSIPERFEKMVRMYPDRLAVKTKNQTITFEELNRTANRLAHAILAKRGQGNEPIALLFEHGIDVIAAIFGTLKAGKFILALDPSFPLERLTYMLEDSQARLIVTNNRNVGLVNKLRQDSRQLLNIDESDDSLSTADLGLTVSPVALSHLIYTSGSTGKPKGVVQNHRNMLHEMVAYTNGFHICPQDRMTLLASCSSGQGIKNAFCALLNGAGLYPLDIKCEGVARLADHVVQEEITVYHSSVTLFRYFLRTLTGGEKFPHLRLIRLASQQVLKEDVELYRKHFSPHCILVNALSSTETGTFRWLFMNKETEIKENIVPVGYAMEDKKVLLLDDNEVGVGSNRAGEIAVKSRYISPGYWQKPNLTRSKFLPDSNGGDERLYLTGDLGRMTPEGCLIYIGRKDFRVKVRGYSVEVAEIEKVLLEHAGIRDAVVVARAGRLGDTSLVAYFVPRGKSRATISELQDFLKEKLPDYMIPSTFVMLDKMPLMPNGKVVRQALPDPGNQRPMLDTAFVAPKTSVEKELAQIWDEVLSVDQVGIHDNFFDLGGHSLAATRVVSQVIKKFQLALPLQSLFQSPTIAEMAAVIAKHQGKNLGDEELDRILTELEALSDEEAQRLLSGRSEAGLTRD